MNARRLLRLTACLLLAAPLARAQVVTNTNASGAGSLRAVIAAAAPGATITFAPALSGQTISLGGSQIPLDKNVTIDGSALPLGIQITQPTESIGRIFLVQSNVTAHLKGMTLWGGGGYGGEFELIGGAIKTFGNLTLTACTLGNNFANSGGAVANHGGTLIINQCTLTRNFNDSEIGNGAAIYSHGGIVHVNQSTITQNTSLGDPRYNPDGTVFLNSATLRCLNSIIAGNTVSLEIDSRNSNAPSFIGTNLIGGDPKLMPLGHYGGPTQTMPPLSSSPALNTGTDFVNTGVFGVPIGITDFFPTDQRGQPRIHGTHVDIGAVELQSPTVVTNLADAGPGSLRQALSDFEPWDNTITFADALSGQSIQLASTLQLNRNLIIDASSLSAGIKLLGSDRVLQVAADKEVLLRALEIRNGFHNDAGAGIHNAGILTLDRCTLASNGGVFEGTYRPLEGGAIYNAGTLTLNQCTLAGNVANSGAGIFNHTGANLTVNQSTLAGNEGNVSTGGIRNRGTLTLNNTILTGNSTSSSFDPNLIDSGTSTLLGNNLTTGDPQLAALGNYGGPTQTMPPLPGSPAKDKTNLGILTLSMDQRGFPRLIGSALDIGAVEEIPGATFPGTNLTDLWKSDSDGDGIPFGTEYALGTNPFVSDASAPGLLQLQIGPDKQITFGRNPAAVPNTQWVLKRSPNLQPGSFTEVFRFNGPTGISTSTSGVTATIGTSGFTITDPTPSPRNFYRLETVFTP
jgi:hypothetical protein